MTREVDAVDFVGQFTSQPYSHIHCTSNACTGFVQLRPSAMLESARPTAGLVGPAHRGVDNAMLITSAGMMLCGTLANLSEAEPSLLRIRFDASILLRVGPSNPARAGFPLAHPDGCRQEFER